MKIGVLTYYWSENPGTFLQAWSTCKAVQRVFPESQVELINTRYANRSFFFSRKYLKSLSLFVKAIKRYMIYNKVQKRFPYSNGEFVGKDTHAALNYIEEQKYDIIFVGSDTVFQLYDWNIENERLPVYYLDGITAKKVMLAASCGASDIKVYTKSMRDKASECLSKFVYLGIRDQNTYDLFSELKGSSDDIEIIPDPTFTYDIDYQAAQEYLSKIGFDFERPSVIINMPYRIQYMQEIADYFKRQGWQILTFNSAWYADHNCFVGPDQWSGMPKYVSLVLTDRFHGAVFSFKNHTPIIGVDCEKHRVTSLNSSKLRCVLEEYNMLDKYFNMLDMKHFDEIKNAFEKCNNFDSENVERINQAKCSEYLGYLQKVKSSI